MFDQYIGPMSNSSELKNSVDLRLVSSAGKPSVHSTVYFMRPELARILNVYGRMVAGGKWFDYAIDTMKGQAMFSVYRRASEMPLYRIIKEPALASKQGMWRIQAMNGKIVKRGKSLDNLLRYFDRKLLQLID